MMDSKIWVLGYLVFDNINILYYKIMRSTENFFLLAFLFIKTQKNSFSSNYKAIS